MSVRAIRNKTNRDMVSCKPYRPLSSRTALLVSLCRHLSRSTASTSAQTSAAGSAGRSRPEAVPRPSSSSSQSRPPPSDLSMDGYPLATITSDLSADISSLMVWNRWCRPKHCSKNCASPAAMTRFCTYMSP